MTTGELIRAALAADATVAALVAGPTSDTPKIFPNVAPQGTVPPWIVYQVTSDVPQNAVTGDASDRMVNAHVQIDCYSKSYLEAHAVDAAVDAVLSALAGSELNCWRDVTRDLYDNEAELHRVNADYSVFR